MELLHKQQGVAKLAQNYISIRKAAGKAGAITAAGVTEGVSGGAEKLPQGHSLDKSILQ